MSFDEDFDVTLKAIRCLGTFARSLPSSCNAMVTPERQPYPKHDVLGHPWGGSCVMYTIALH